MRIEGGRIVADKESEELKFGSVTDILDFAIEREEDAARAYGELARDASDPAAKVLLSELQTEEKNHKRLLQNIMDGKACALPSREVQDLKISDYLVEEPLDAQSGFQDLLIHAARKEAKAVQFYTCLWDLASDPEFRRLLTFLIQEESKHKLKLEQEYEKQILQED
jgi:rubrerythrin